MDNETTSSRRVLLNNVASRYGNKRIHKKVFSTSFALTFKWICYGSIDAFGRFEGGFKTVTLVSVTWMSFSLNQQVRNLLSDNYPKRWVQRNNPVDH